MEDKERKTPIDFGVKRSKVKVIVTCTQRGPLWLCQFSSYAYDIVYWENFTPVLFSPFSSSDKKANSKLGELKYTYLGLYNEIEERGNSKLGESVLDLYSAKIRLGIFKAVYSNFCWTYFVSRDSLCKTLFVAIEILQGCLVPLGSFVSMRPVVYWLIIVSFQGFAV